MIAAEQKPRLVKGDLRTDLAALAREAPKDATLVIFHTAVLAYISLAAEREEFARSVGSLCDYWIANEAPQVFPDIARRASWEGPRGSFLLSVNGAPMAWADPHGAWLDLVEAAPSVRMTRNAGFIRLGHLPSAPFSGDAPPTARSRRRPQAAQPPRNALRRRETGSGCSGK